MIGNLPIWIQKVNYMLLRLFSADNFDSAYLFIGKTLLLWKIISSFERRPFDARNASQAIYLAIKFSQRSINKLKSSTEKDYRRPV